MKVFGLTGGIGMGKTVAGDWLRQHGVPVADTDVIAREIVEPGQPAWCEIQETFGTELVGPDGHLRRDDLARIVFSDAVARRKLESLTHPRIREVWRRQVDGWRDGRHESAAVIIPLLFETGAEAELDATVCIACSATTQRRRLLERGWSPAQIESRVAAQWPIEKKMARADYVLWSEGGPDILANQLERIFCRQE